jgi:hypothetical protein
MRIDIRSENGLQTFRLPFAIKGNEVEIIGISVLYRAREGAFILRQEEPLPLGQFTH